MNPGIFYLYEYNNTQKLRNAGFLKITRYYHSCTLQLNARGIPVSYADTIKLYVFYLENNLTETTFLKEIPCTNHALSARITSAESQFPSGRTLDNVDGFFLLLPNGHVLAAAAPGTVIDVQKLLSTSSGSSSEEQAPNNTESPSEIPTSDMIPNQTEIASESSNEIQSLNETSDETESTNEAPVTIEAESIHEDNTDEPSESSPLCTEPEAPDEQPPLTESNSSEEQNTSAQTDSSEEQNASAQPDSSEEQCSSAQTDPSEEQNSSTQSDSSEEQNSSAQPNFSEEQNTSTQPDSSAEQCSSPEQGSSHQSVRKIQRSELSGLPRKYWHLANNSFLLHGYHNYNHLILIEKDGHYWLGVPGIYDPREARAARLFGFPQFTDSYNKLLQLSDDECNPNENFGYWCCYLK